jgi:hypothetical protein
MKVMNKGIIYITINLIMYFMFKNFIESKRKKIAIVILYF